MNNDPNTIIALGFAALILIGYLLFHFWLSPYQEAKAYNRITGANVSTWDAIWLDLRVQEQPKK